MNGLLSRYWLLLPILIIVVVALDQIEAPTVVEVEETIDMRATRSDYYLADFTTRRFRADGMLEYTVKGETLAHYPDDNRSEITSPRVLMNRPEATWDIRSDTGRFNTDPDLFTLQGDVTVIRQREGQDPVTITTSSLSVATDSNELSTDKPIEIVASSWEMNAVGMTSSLDDGKLILLSAVSGRYEATFER